jgi:putative membrane protein
MAAGLLCGSVAFIACNSNTRETDTTSNVDTELNAAAVADTALTGVKRDFMGYAYNISNQQVELGKLAVERGVTAQVREHGQQLVDLYGKKLQELKEMSGQYNVTLPQHMTEDEAGRVEALRDKSQDEFDKAYWDTVIETDKAALKEFEDNVKDIAETDNTTFNLWARNTAKEIRAQMENAMRARAN